MDRHTETRQVQRLEVIETGRRRRWTPEAKLRIVEESYPNAQEEFFEGLVERIYEDEDDQFETFVLDELPGIELAINSEIVFHLRMPGRITAATIPITAIVTRISNSVNPRRAGRVAIRIRCRPPMPACRCRSTGRRSRRGSDAG